MNSTNISVSNLTSNLTSTLTSNSVGNSVNDAALMAPLEDFMGFWTAINYSNLFIAIVIVIVSIVIARIANTFVERYFKKITSRTKSEVDDKLLGAVQKPIYYVIILIGIQTAITYLLVSTTYAGYFTLPLKIVMILIVTWVVAGVAEILLNEFGRRIAQKTKTTADDEAIPFLSKVIRAGIYLISLMTILDLIGIEVSPLVASLGIAGFAIGFAAKDTLGNLLAGFFIMTDRPFKKGDRVEIAGYLGEIVDIGLRTTKIMTLDSNVVIIPNSKIISNEVTNYTLPSVRIKVKIPLGVAYGSDVDEVKKIILDVAKKADILEDPAPSVFFREFGESSLNFLLIVWVDTFRIKFGVTDQVNSMLYKEFDKAGIDIPFPCRTVYLKKES